jgi:glycerol kinase
MSTADYLLAIDQGTTSTRAILFDTEGAVHHTARRDLRQIYPQPGWVEHDAEEIWRAAVATCREAVAAARGRAIAAIGISNQRETTVLW